jgi:hypothetical protein
MRRNGREINLARLLDHCFVIRLDRDEFGSENVDAMRDEVIQSVNRVRALEVTEKDFRGVELRPISDHDGANVMFVESVIAEVMYKRDIPGMVTYTFWNADMDPEDPSAIICTTITKERSNSYSPLSLSRVFLETAKSLHRLRVKYNEPRPEGSLPGTQ